MGEMRKIDSRN